MKICQECGTPCNDETVFCYICGSKFSDEQKNIVKSNTLGQQSKQSVTPSEENNDAIAPLLQRISLFLEDEEYDRANEYCERVLDMEPTNAEAYFDKLLVEYQCSSAECLKGCMSEISSSKNYAKIMRFGNEQQKNAVLSINEEIQRCIRIAVKDGATLEMNGVYFFLENGFRHLLRFFPNGEVQGTIDRNAVIPSPAEIQGITYRNQGKYTIENLQLTFSLNNRQGQVDYWGIISKDKLILNWHSHINGHRASNEEYLFTEM